MLAVGPGGFTLLYCTPAEAVPGSPASSSARPQATGSLAASGSPPSGVCLKMLSVYFSPRVEEGKASLMHVLVRLCFSGLFLGCWGFFSPPC